MNQKNHYVSTYQKDYTWPHVLGVRRIQPPIKPILAVKGCTCTDPRQMLKELLSTGLGKYYDWSRMGPTGRLLEPKIYSKIASISEANVMRVDQPPSIFVRKLDEKCSSLSGVLKKADERTIARVEADRMKTTYQADYSDPAAARMTQRDVALVIVDTNGQQLQCCMPIKITVEDNCLPHCRLFPSRYKGSTSVCKQDYKRKNGLKCSKKGEGIERRYTLLSSWRSEYQDSISKIGHTIMRAKLHHAKRKTTPSTTPVQYYQHCTTSN